jgi:dimeric dUTPase (all-alpha-NTP-PPase superfamily)
MIRPHPEQPVATSETAQGPIHDSTHQQSASSGGCVAQDKLAELFRMQEALNARIGVHTSRMSQEDKTKWILNYTRAMTQEMAELTDSVPWKWWAKYQKFDEQNARVEVVDLFHFLISMAQVLGMSSDDVFNAYVKKNEVNFKRQEGGYIVKDEADSRHI